MHCAPGVALRASTAEHVCGPCVRVTITVLVCVRGCLKCARDELFLAPVVLLRLLFSFHGFIHVPLIGVLHCKVDERCPGGVAWIGPNRWMHDNHNANGRGVSRAFARHQMSVPPHCLAPFSVCNRLTIVCAHLHEGWRDARPHRAAGAKQALGWCDTAWLGGYGARGTP